MVIIMLVFAIINISPCEDFSSNVLMSNILNATILILFLALGHTKSHSWSMDFSMKKKIRGCDFFLHLILNSLSMEFCDQ